MSTAAVPTRPQPQSPLRAQYLDLRANVHRKLLNRLNLEALAQTDRARAESEIRALLTHLLAEEVTPLSLAEREGLFAEVLDDVFGLGPLEPLLRDTTVSDILVNTYKHVFVERGGRLERVTATFQDDRHLLRVIDRIVSRIGRRVDDSSPMVDARLEDGSRVNAIIPPLAVDGPLLSIRRFPAERLKAEDLVTLKALTAPMLEFLSHCVRARMNCLISGGTGAGKTTLLNVLSGFISDRERIVTIEDAAELQLHQDHVVRLETRPPNVEGKGAIRQPERAMRQQITSAIQLVLQQTRLSDGTRRVTSVSEITGMEGDTITMQEIFVFVKLGINAEGMVIGRFRATGVRPKVCERLKAAGIVLPGTMFEGLVEIR